MERFVIVNRAETSSHQEGKVGSPTLERLVSRKKKVKKKRNAYATVSLSAKQVSSGRRRAECLSD